MNFENKKYGLYPLVVSLAMLALSPIIPISNQAKNQTKDNFKDEPNKSSSDNSIINTILDSFGLENRVFADCNTYPTNCNVTAPNICVPEGIDTPESISAQASGGYVETYPVSIDIQNTTGITVSPIHGDFNNYPSGSPSNNSVTLDYDVTGAPVSVTDDPGDGSGPYGGLGRKIFSLNAHVGYEDWNNSAWTGDASTQDQAYTIAVDHVNTAPTVSAISDDFSATASDSSVLTDVPISFTISDVESNHTNIVVDLSSDNFNTILQTTTFSDVAAGTPENYTFNSVPVGTYQWRVTATETDAVGTCAGFSNAASGVDLQVSETKNISITLPGSSNDGSSNQNSNTSSSNSNGGSVGSPSCSNQKPGVPTDLNAVSGPGKGQETLSWFAPSGPVTDYSLTYSNNPNTKLWGVVSTGNATNYVISDLGSGKYYFWVNAVNGCMPGDAVSFSNLTLPPTGSNNIIYVGMLGIVFMAVGAVYLLLI